MPSKRRKIVYGAVMVAITLALGLLIGEWGVRLLAPVTTLSPRYEHSEQYGLIPYPNVTMRHQMPGSYDFHYTVSSSRTRGAELPDPERTVRPVVVVLGDSNAFGMGVDDGEEFPAILQSALGDAMTVVNLGAPGWGLAQQIRRYVELGARYRPAFVVLQYCQNDLADNLLYPVTVASQGELEFVDMPREGNRALRQMLSRSPLQRSQLYNLLRQAAYEWLKRDRLNDSKPVPDVAAEPDPRVLRHTELLELFAKRLRAEGVQLLLVSVTGQLEQKPELRAAVDRLAAAGLLHYADSRPWFDGVDGYASPEGHAWGRTAHAIVGRELAAGIQRLRTAYR